MEKRDNNHGSEAGKETVDRRDSLSVLFLLWCMFIAEAACAATDFHSSPGSEGVSDNSPLDKRKPRQFTT